MRTALLVFALLAAPAFASQSVWKWVDDKGVTHYSDRPVQGAQKVEIAVGSRSDTYRSSSASPSDSGNQRNEAAETYRNFEILRPGNDETIPNTGGSVDVRLRFEPALRSGDSVRLYLNGRLVEDFPPTALEYTLQNVPRGEHTLVAVIQAPGGRRLAETPMVRFHVRQQSIAQPPVGPALRQPPPQPRPRGQQASNKLPTSQPTYAELNGQRAAIDPRTNAPVKK
jgi:hypothetical protein